jgi:putative solute:sodium symporter small subunit
MDRTEQKPYWRYTKWQMMASLLPYLMLMIVLPLYVDKLNSNRFLGFPLGYLLIGHGLSLVFAVFTISSFVNRQDAIDHWYGANEDI